MAADPILLSMPDPHPMMQVETLARQMLQNPIEIQVGGRSVVNSDITQVGYRGQPKAHACACALGCGYIMYTGVGVSCLRQAPIVRVIRR